MLVDPWWGSRFHEYSSKTRTAPSLVAYQHLLEPPPARPARHSCPSDGGVNVNGSGGGGVSEVASSQDLAIDRASLSFESKHHAYVHVSNPPRLTCCTQTLQISASCMSVAVSMSGGGKETGRRRERAWKTFLFLIDPVQSLTASIHVRD